MTINVKLPLDRWKQGTIEVRDENGIVVCGVFSCYGKADNKEAAAHNNPNRYTTFSYGDHPYGKYKIIAIEKDKIPAHTYGSYFILIDPTDGDALVGKNNGRVGLAIHGGDLGEKGILRATNGCLRVTNKDITQIVSHIKIGDTYICDLG